MTKAGFQVTSTDSVAEAKKMIPEPARTFTVAILDNRLGKSRGEEIADLLRQIEQFSIGVICLASEETPWADEYVSKDGLDGNGFESQELLNALARLIKD